MNQNHPIASMSTVETSSSTAAATAVSVGTCNNECRFSHLRHDGYCQDGRPGAPGSQCDPGTDCADCGPWEHTLAPVPVGTCNDECHYDRDGHCDDGRRGAYTSYCDPGTDCADCGAWGQEAGLVEMPTPTDVPTDDWEIAICQEVPQNFGMSSVRQYRCSDSDCEDCVQILSAQEGEPAWYWQDDMGISGAYHCRDKYNITHATFTPLEESWEFGVDLDTCTKEEGTSGAPLYRVWRGCENHEGPGMQPPKPKVTWKGHPDGNTSLPGFSFEVALVKVDNTPKVNFTIGAEVVNSFSFWGTGHIEGKLLTVDTKNGGIFTRIATNNSTRITETFVTEMLGNVTSIEIVDNKSLRVAYGGDNKYSVLSRVNPPVPPVVPTSDPAVEVFKCEGPCQEGDLTIPSHAPVPDNCKLIQTSIIGEPAVYHTEDISHDHGRYECNDDGPPGSRKLVFRPLGFNRNHTDIPVTLDTCVTQNPVTSMLWRAPSNVCTGESLPPATTLPEPLVKYDFTGTLVVAGGFWPRYFGKAAFGTPRVITSAADDGDDDEAVFVAAAGKTVRGKRGKFLREPFNRAFRQDLATIFGGVPIEHVHILHIEMYRPPSGDRGMHISFQVDRIAASKGSGWVPPEEEVTLPDFPNVEALLSEREVEFLLSNDEPFDFLSATEELPPVIVCPPELFAIGRTRELSQTEKMSTSHIILIAASGAFIIAIVALSVCVCVLKKRLNRAQQSTQLMRTTSEPYGRMPVSSSMTAPVAGVPVDDPSTLEKAKEVETVKDIEVLTVKSLDVEEYTAKENTENPLDGV